jgi:hypothetical protein
MEHLREIEGLAPLIALSENVEVQLRCKEDWTPVMAILSEAEEEAAAAMVALTTAPEDRPDVIRELKNRVWRFEALVRWLRKILMEGAEAGRRITELRRDVMAEYVIDDDTKEALGLADQGPGSE